MRDIRAPSKLTTKTARKAKAACVVEYRTVLKRWKPRAIFATRKAAIEAWGDQLTRFPEIYRIKKYTRAD